MDSLARRLANSLVILSWGVLLVAFGAIGDQETFGLLSGLGAVLALASAIIGMAGQIGPNKNAKIKGLIGLVLMVAGLTLSISPGVSGFGQSGLILGYVLLVAGAVAWSSVFLVGWSRTLTGLGSPREWRVPYWILAGAIASFIGFAALYALAAKNSFGQLNVLLEQDVVFLAVISTVVFYGLAVLVVRLIRQVSQGPPAGGVAWTLLTGVASATGLALLRATGVIDDATLEVTILGVGIVAYLVLRKSRKLDFGNDTTG